MFIHLEWYEMHPCHMLFIEYLVQVVRKIKDWPQNLISVQVGMLCFMLNKNQKFLWLNVHLSKCWMFWGFFPDIPKIQSIACTRLCAQSKAIWGGEKDSCIPDREPSVPQQPKPEGHVWGETDLLQLLAAPSVCQQICYRYKQVKI